MQSIILYPLKESVTKEVRLPGCIGYTIRALAISAMTKGSVRIRNPLKSDDTYAMVTALRELGIMIDEEKDCFIVHGDISDIQDKEYEITIGLSGRSARTLLAFLSVVPGTKILTCKDPFKKRPIEDLVTGLTQMGAQITYLEKEGHLPVKINSSKLSSGHISMNGTMSSQYFSAIMMIAPLVGEITIDVLGEQSSKPFIDMTIAIMEEFGVQVINNEYKQYTMAAGQVYHNPKNYIVEPEATSASYFFAIAALTKSTIRVQYLHPHSAQGDKAFADMLGQMGCVVKKNEAEKWIEVTGTDTLTGITVNLNATPDLVPTLAVVAAFAKEKTVMTGIAHARVKETDRIASPQKELAKMNITTEATEDTFTVYGGVPKGATIQTYHDHRMAMAFAVAGAKIRDMSIEDPEVVSKSFPTFWEKLAGVGVSNERKNEK
ncbi:MAG: 3-phosphoshikimate 1-carboxyvinyltransferase [Patescibacteria group bacterium]